MVNNLENIPACLRVIARQIEKGEIDARIGFLTLRGKGSPTIFGFGKSVNPKVECDKALVEFDSLVE